MTVVFALIGLALAATLALGLGAWRQRRHQPVSFFDYAVAGGGARWGTVLASVLAAETSAATLLGVPAEGLALGTYHHLQILAGMVLGRVVVAVTFLPHLHRRGVVSIYGLLGSRFGPRTQRLGAATFLVTRLLSTGTRVYVGAIVLAVAVELAQGGRLAPAPKLGLYVLAALVLCGFTALYTSLGGMRAVLWTDTLQTGIMLTAVGGCLIFLLQTVGWAPLMAAPLLDWGWGENAGTLATLRHIRLSPYTVWSGLIGTLFTTLATHGVDQDAMQRLLAAPDLRRARRALVLSGLCEIPILTTLASIGILLRAHLGSAGAVLRPGNEIFAHFILTGLPPGLCALMLTAVMTTTMGSLSAALNALATSYTQDWRRTRADDQAAVAVARRATWGMAAILATIASATAALVLLQPELRIIPLVMGVLGWTYGPLLAIFLHAMFGPGGTDRSSSRALVGGIAASCLLQNFFPVTFCWRVLVGTAITGLLATCLAQLELPTSPQAGADPG